MNTMGMTPEQEIKEVKITISFIRVMMVLFMVVDLLFHLTNGIFRPIMLMMHIWQRLMQHEHAEYAQKENGEYFIISLHCLQRNLFIPHNQIYADYDYPGEPFLAGASVVRACLPIILIMVFDYYKI